MFDITNVVLFVVVFVLSYLYWKGRAPSCLPPGPKGWPFIGHLDLIYYGKEKKFHVIADKWGKQYGGLYTIQLGHIPSVMVTDLDILKEALVDKSDVWSDRPLNNSFIKLITGGEGGVILQNGETWKEVRRLTVKSMRDFGVGKKSIEEKIQEELKEVLKEIDATGGKSFQFDFLFHKAVTNVICSILFGNRYLYDDPLYKKLTAGLNEMFKGSGFQNIFLFLPWYTFWLMPLLQRNIKKLFDTNKFLQSFIEQVIKEHRQTFDKENLRDFVDIYLDEEETDSSKIYTERRMFQVIMDLFLAGAETTSTTLLWAFLFLIKYPDVQEKCRLEIKEKFGLARPITYAEKVELPYVEATLCEVLRLGNTGPILSFHNTAFTSTLRGYTIPKDTAFMGNLYSIHMDPKNWDEPKEFRPERFLGDDGKVKRPEAFLAFGLGKRACLGETLARMEMFIFLTGLLQNFEFKAEDVSKLPSVENTSLGLTLIPAQYSVKAGRIA